MAKDLLAWPRRSTIIQKFIEWMNTRAPSFAPVCRSSIAGRQVFLSAQVVQRKLTVALGLDRSRRFLAPEKNGTAAIRPGPQLIGPIGVDQTTPAARVGSLASRGFWPANGCSTEVQRIARPCRPREVETVAQGMACSSSCHWLIRSVSTFQVQQGRMTAIIIDRLPTLSGISVGCPGPLALCPCSEVALRAALERVVRGKSHSAAAENLVCSVGWKKHVLCTRRRPDLCAYGVCQSLLVATRLNKGLDVAHGLTRYAVDSS
jgi:hypothetical protein